MPVVRGVLREHVVTIAHGRVAAGVRVRARDARRRGLEARRALAPPESRVPNSEIRQLPDGTRVKYITSFFFFLYVGA